MKNVSKRLISIMLVAILVIGMQTTSVFAAGSTLKISGNTAITSIVKGKGTSTTGTITSNYKITNVTGAIKDSAGKVKYSKSVNPNAKKYVLKRSAIDNALKFGKLAEGTYSYTISATDASGKTATLVNNTFTVSSAATANGASTLKITDATAPGTLIQGNIWHCTGTISSNYKLKTVTGKILDAAGKTMSSKTVKTSALQYVMKKSAIDNALTFGKLAVGTYHYEITATDTSGKTLVLVDETFSVVKAGTADSEKASESTSEKASEQASEKASENASEKASEGASENASESTSEKEPETSSKGEPSALKIENAKACTTVVKGNWWHCNGTITSNYNITSITGKITSKSGTALYTRTVKPNATSYALKYSVIDNALAFSKLPAGTYHYIIKATDASGQTLTLVDNTFTVK